MPQRKLTGSQLIRQRKNDKKLFLAAFILEIVILIFSISIIYTFNKYEILPLKYRLLITAILIIANVYFAIILKVGIYKRHVRNLGLVLSVVVLIFSIALSFYMNKGISALNVLSEVAEKPVEVKEVIMTVRVMKSTPIYALSDLEGKTVSAPYSTDKENLDNFYADYLKENENELTVIDVSSYLTAVEELYDSMTPAIILNEDYMSIIEGKFPQFKEQTRVVSSSSLKTEETINIKKVDPSKEPFTMLISGIDTYGSIETSSRSDVNILVTVNPNTKTILMTSIPRDMYMRIPGNGMNEWDKLTHAGIYGVQTSVQAVENFMNVVVNYYFKVNFTSVISLVDLIGGITIDNPYEFNTVDWKTFPAGVQTINGEDALSYVRERYNLPGGDNDRGANQERALAAIIKKLMGKEILVNFNSLIEIAKTSMQTSMSTNEMMKLVNLQLETGSTWKIVMNAVQGDGQYGWNSYAAPGYNVYVMIPYDDSVEEARKQINDVLLDKEIDVPSTDE